MRVHYTAKIIRSLISYWWAITEVIEIELITVSLKNLNTNRSHVNA